MLVLKHLDKRRPKTDTVRSIDPQRLTHTHKTTAYIHLTSPHTLETKQNTGELEFVVWEKYI
jgi:hypothetical protein